METIKEILHFGNNIPKDREVGLEIEVEGEFLPAIFEGYWKTTGDGSLKAAESYEYVLEDPINREKVPLALRQLKAHWKKNHSVIHDSYRAGVHVHINVRELTLVQVINFVILYYIFEDILLKFCGKTREGNHFCLRSKDAEYVLDFFEKCIKENRLARLKTDEIRYSSLNFKALPIYGSLEFRGMRSTEKLEDIEKWIGTLLRIKDTALTYENPTQILKDMSIEGPDKLITNILSGLEDKPHEIEKLVEGEDLRKIVFNSMRRIQSLAYAAENQQDEEEVIINLDLNHYFNKG